MIDQSSTEVMLKVSKSIIHVANVVLSEHLPNLNDHK